MTRRIKNLKAFISQGNRLSKWGFSWGGLLDNRHGEWLLLMQIILLIAHIMPPYPPEINLNIHLTIFFKIIGIITFTIGIVLSINALIEIKPSLSPLPEPIKNAQLILTGPYKHCRHPLYQGLLIISIGTIFYKLSLLHILLLIFLSITLKSKAIREETSLSKLHSNYQNYITNTPAIIPILKYLDWRD